MFPSGTPLLKGEAFPFSLIPIGKPSEDAIRDQGVTHIKSYQRRPEDPAGGRVAGGGQCPEPTCAQPPGTMAGAPECHFE